jgi:hypothetical protein
LDHIGTHTPRACHLNCTDLGWKPRELQHLYQPFSEQEIKQVIFSAPKEKAPGSDGFVGLFFSSCWEMIKEDTIRALHQFYPLNQQGLHFLNQTLVVFIPKKENP